MNSNHQPDDCLLNRLFKVQINEKLKAPRDWPLRGNSPVTDEFPAQRASSAENVSIWWRHHPLINCRVCYWKVTDQRIQSVGSRSRYHIFEIDNCPRHMHWWKSHIWWTRFIGILSSKAIDNNFIVSNFNYCRLICYFTSHNIMTSSNGNIFCDTGPLCGVFTGHQWIPRTKVSDAELWFETPSRSLWRHCNGVLSWQYQRTIGCDFYYSL